MEVINSSELTRFVMGAEVVDFVKKALIVNTTIGSFKTAILLLMMGLTFSSLTARVNPDALLRCLTGSFPLRNLPARNG